jgi:hypothetical protein
MMDKLGMKAKDKITGVKGVITGKCTYLYGCSQYCIVPESKDNKHSDGCWYDEGRIVVIEEGIKPEEVKADKDGGPSCGPVCN